MCTGGSCKAKNPRKVRPSRGKLASEASPVNSKPYGNFD